MIECMRCHLQCKVCHAYAECGVINTECCDVILTGYYVIYTGDMISQIYWMWYHPYSGCDVLNRVGVMTQIQWTEVTYSGLDVIHKVV